jgi:hypothetical protein
MSRRERERTQERISELALRVGQGAPRRSDQPDLADSFRKAKASLEIASRDIVAMRRRVARLARRSGS